MYELKKKIGKVLTSKSVGIGPSSYEKRIYRAAVSQSFRNTAVDREKTIIMERPSTSKIFQQILRSCDKLMSSCSSMQVKVVGYILQYFNILQNLLSYNF